MIPSTVPSPAESSRDLAALFLRTGDDESSVDPRARAAWRTWLKALATDADAALAAALAYESLDDGARDGWLDSLEQDGPTLGVPLIALYAPLLSVEGDLIRRQRMVTVLSTAAGMEGRRSADEVIALRGVGVDGVHVSVILSPVYLNFVEILVCRYTRTGGFVSVRHDPLRNAADGPRPGGSLVEGVAVEVTPLRVVVEELAHAILAERRAGRPAPNDLAPFAHLFGLDVEGVYEPS